MIHIQKLSINARHIRWIALVIVIDELDRASEQATLGVDLLLPDLHPEQRLLPIGGKRSS